MRRDGRSQSGSVRQQIWCLMRLASRVSRLRDAQVWSGKNAAIVLIRILRPGNPVPADIKPFVNKHPEMTTKVCALVEFERTEFAHKAVRELNNEDSEDKSDEAKEEGESKESKESKEGGGKMKVMELTAPPPKTTKNKASKNIMVPSFQQQRQMPPPQQRRFSHAGFNMVPQQLQQGSMELGPRRRISLFHNMKFPITEEPKKDYGLNPDAPTFQMQQGQQQQQQHQRRISRPPYLHPAAAMEAAAAHTAAAQAAHHAAANMQMLQQQQQQSQWMMRRLSSGINNLDMGASACGLTIAPNVVRMPKGPDKGKGFQKWCRSRMDTTSPTTPTGTTAKKSHAVPIVAPPAEGGEEEKENNEVEKVQDDDEKDIPTLPAPDAVAVAANDNDQKDDGKPVLAVDQEEPVVDGAAAAAAAAAPAVAQVAPAAGGGAPDLGSDSGHEEDCSFADDIGGDPENERAR